MRKLFLQLLLSFGFFSSLSAQNAQTISGNWKGIIDIQGVELEIETSFKKNEEKWNGTISIPLQNVKAAKLDEISNENTTWSFAFPEAPGNALFTGTLNNTSDSLKGEFLQSGMSFPFYLVRISEEKILAETVNWEQKVAKFTALADSLRKQEKIPGLGIALVFKDKSKVFGLGVRDIENELPADSNTLFAIGSCSKAFTAALLAMLVEEGKLDWEAPIRTYLPDFELKDAFATAEMNATDLLTHRSGLPRHDMLWYGAEDSREELYHKLKYLEPSKSFRTAFQYNNLMYMTAGYLVGKLAGSSWETFLESRIFQALKMNTANSSIEALEKNEYAATPYYLDEDSNKTMPYRNLNAIAPAGAINASATDMRQWLQFLLNKGEMEGNRLLSATSVQNLFAPQIPLPGGSSQFKSTAYAKGWFTYTYQGYDVVEHGGNIDGFTAEVYLMPEKELGIVILANQNATSLPVKLCRYAADIFTEIDTIDWYIAPNEVEEEKKKKEETDRVKGTKPMHSLEAYTGTYEHPAYGTVKIMQKGKMLSGIYHDWEMPMEHWHYEVFQAEVKALQQKLTILFQTDVNGKVTSLSIPFDPFVEAIVFEKQAPALLSDSAYLESLCGTYVFESGNLHIERTGKTGLQVSVDGQLFQLVPYDLHQFSFAEVKNIRIRFEWDKKQKKVIAMTIIQPYRTERGEKKKESVE